MKKQNKTEGEAIASPFLSSIFPSFFLAARTAAAVTAAGAFSLSPPPYYRIHCRPDQCRDNSYSYHGSHPDYCLQSTSLPPQRRKEKFPKRISPQSDKSASKPAMPFQAGRKWRPMSTSMTLSRCGLWRLSPHREYTAIQTSSSHKR